MAKKVSVQLVCDSCGTDLDEKDVQIVRLGIDGDVSSLDLCDKCAGEFDAQVQPWFKMGEVEQTKSKVAKRVKKATEWAPAQVRAWAADNGIEVSARGRIPQSVMDAFEKGRIEGRK